MQAVLSEIRAFNRRRALPQKTRAGALAAVIQAEVIFVHIPKCGGKSVVRDVYGLGLHDWFGHADIEFYRAILGPKRFDKFAKFTVVRHPLDRCRSGFNFMKQGGFGGRTGVRLKEELRDISFEEFVCDGLLEPLMRDFVVFRPQWSFVCDAQGQLLVDKICRLETLKTDLADVLGPKFRAQDLSHENKSDAGSIDSVPDHVAEKVHHLYQRDFELFRF